MIPAPFVTFYASSTCIFSTGGYTDGRTRESIPREEILHSELWPTAQAVAGRIAYALGDEPSAVPQCTQGNVC